MVLGLCVILAWLSTLRYSTVGPPRAEGRPALARLSRRTPKPDRGDWPGLLGPNGDCSTNDAGLNLDWGEAGPPVAWRRPIGTGYSAPVTRGADLVVFHRLGDAECIDCLDAATGERRWGFLYPTAYHCRFEYSNGPYSTPLLDETSVYAWGAEGVLHCLRRSDGELVWRRSLHEDYAVPRGDFPVAASPLAEGELLILNVGGTRGTSGIIAVDHATGETRWQSTTEPAAYATPVVSTIHGRRMVFVLGYDHLVALDPLDGKVLWQTEFHAKNRDLGKFNATSPLVVGECVIVSAYAAGTLCVRVRSDGGYEERWKVNPRVLDSQYTPLVLGACGLFGFTNRNHSLSCLNVASGELLWQWPSEIGRDAQMLRVEDRLLTLGETGQLAIFDVGGALPKLVSLTDRPVIDPPCFTTPIIAGGCMFVRNEKEIVCFKLKGD